VIPDVLVPVRGAKGAGLGAGLGTVRGWSNVEIPQPVQNVVDAGLFEGAVERVVEIYSNSPEPGGILRGATRCRVAAGLQ
jgi:hypothetical protein